MELDTLRLVAKIGAASFGAPGLLCAAWWASRNLRRAPRCFCPGPRRSIVLRLFPPAWFFARPCGYDLRGLPTRDDQSVTCPECGRTLRPDRTALRRVFRWRAGRTAGVLLTLAILAAFPYLLKTTSWQRHVPTTALIWGKRLLGTSHMPTRLRRVLEERIEIGQLSALQVDWVIPALAADLRTDHGPRNAVRATHLLTYLGEKGLAQLERSLRSPDAQERECAAVTLRGHLVQWEEDPEGGRHSHLIGKPSDDLLRVTLENLDSRSYWTLGLDFAGDPYAFLALFPDRVIPLITTGLEAPDPIYQLHCAGLAMLMRIAELLPRTAAILIDHLKDNHQYRDASFAAFALRSAGPDVEQLLLPYLYSSDRQQCGLVRAVVQSFHKPDADAENSLYRSFFAVTEGAPQPDFP